MATGSGLDLLQANTAGTHRLLFLCQLYDSPLRLFPPQHHPFDCSIDRRMICAHPLQLLLQRACPTRGVSALPMHAAQRAMQILHDALLPACRELRCPRRLRCFRLQRGHAWSERALSERACLHRGGATLPIPGHQAESAARQRCRTGQDHRRARCPPVLWPPSWLQPQTLNSPVLRPPPWLQPPAAKLLRHDLDCAPPLPALAAVWQPPPALPLSPAPLLSGLLQPAPARAASCRPARTAALAPPEKWP